jgi:ParB family transcriptional regulator, chromosome partitioning protein
MSNQREKRAGDVFLLPVDQIKIEEGFNQRVYDEKDLQEFADVIEADGEVIVPVMVTKVRGSDEYILINGHRRRLATDIVNSRGNVQITHFKAIKGPADKSERFILQYKTNTGLPNTEYEKAMIIQQLLDLGHKSEVIRGRLGIPQGTYSMLVKLLQAPEQVLTMVKEQTLSGTTAWNLAMAFKNDDEGMIKAATNAVETAQAEAKKEGKEKKKATPRHAGVGASRTHQSILKDVLSKVDESSRESALLQAILDKKPTDEILKLVG